MEQSEISRSKQNSALRIHTAKGRSRSTKILIAVGAVVVVLLLLILVDFAAYHNKIHAGVSVGGQSLGGLTREAAVKKLSGLLAESQKSEITYTADGKKWTVSASRVGAKVDVDKTVSAALAASTDSNFIVDLGHRIAFYFKGKDVPAQGTLDTKAVEQVIADIAGDADQPAANAQLTMDNGVPNVTEGKSGTIVNRASVREDLKGLLFTLKSTQKPLPMMTDNPVVKAADTQQAVAQAKTMMSSAITLENGSKTWTITPDQMTNYFDFKVQQENGVSTLVPYLSAKKMSALFADVNKVVTVAAKDAKFVPSGNTCAIQPSVDGKQVDQDQTAAALTTAAMATGNRTAQVVLTTKEADLTTAEAQGMGIKDVLGHYATQHQGTTNRQQNVRITANYASGVLLAPGEIYDFIKTVGPRTPARGYLLAPGITGGGKLEDVYGGGICQVSTTLYNAALVAGLEIVERKNHSLYISHYPMGRDATVSDSYPNMRFRNDTAHYIYVYGTSDGIHTSFTIFGTSDGRKVEISPASAWYNVTPMTTEQTVNPSLPVGTTNVVQDGQNGKQCFVTRKVTAADGTVLHNDKFVSTYPMLPKKVEVGGKTTTPTTKSTTTTAKSTTTTTH